MFQKLRILIEKSGEFSFLLVFINEKYRMKLKQFSPLTIEDSYWHCFQIILTDIFIWSFPMACFLAFFSATLCEFANDLFFGKLQILFETEFRAVTVTPPDGYVFKMRNHDNAHKNPQKGCVGEETRQPSSFLFSFTPRWPTPTSVGCFRSLPQAPPRERPECSEPASTQSLKPSRCNFIIPIPLPSLFSPLFASFSFHIFIFLSARAVSFYIIILFIYYFLCFRNYHGCVVYHVTYCICKNAYFFANTVFTQPVLYEKIQTSTPLIGFRCKEQLSTAPTATRGAINQLPHSSVVRN